MGKELKPHILYEDAHICVCQKPPGLPCESMGTSQADIVKLLKKRYFLQNPKNGEPYVSLVHRLDQPVGGIMVLARNQKAAADLSTQIQNHTFIKQYLALVVPEKKISRLSGHLEDYLVKEARTNISRIASPEEKQAKKAILDYEILKQGQYQGKDVALVKVTLKTGRHHQIRVQMAGHGMPLIFDQKYNPVYKDDKSGRNTALYAFRLGFRHPVTKKQMEFTEYPKAEFFPGEFMGKKLFEK